MSIQPVGAGGHAQSTATWPWGYAPSHQNATPPPPGNDSGTWGWTQVTTTPTAPSPRAGAAMVYDAATGFTLLFGGCPAWGGLYWSHDCTALGDTWALNNGTWVNLTPILMVAPPPRADAGIAYDSAIQSVVLFGGFDGSTLYNDTWLFSGGQWSQAHPSVNPPARFSPGMTGDVAAGDVVLFGGGYNLGANVYNDTWTYQGGNWAQVSTSVAPAPRFSMAMSFDPVDQYVLLFSGWSTNQRLSFGDSWTFANGVWTNITATNGPIPRNYAAMAFDPALNATIMTGGHVVADAYNDTWAQNVTSGWQYFPTTSAPPARWGLEIVYDAVSDELYLFGGVNANIVFFNDLWEFGHTTPENANWTWTELTTVTSPSPRAGAAMVYDAAAGYTVLFGGCPSWGGLYWSHDCIALGDTWILNNGTWTNLTSYLTVSPPARADAGIAYDAADQCVVLFGGFDGSTLYNDTWTFSAGAWTQMHPTTSPSARFSPGMVGDAADHEVVLFGGAYNTGGSTLNDTWTYQGDDWSQVPTAVAPAPRFSMTMSYDPIDQYVLLFSGWSPSQPLSFGDSWTFANGTWTNITTAYGPIPRNYAAMVFDPALDASIMTGGHVEANAYSDTWAQNTSSGWQHIATGAAPPARWGLELAYDGASGTLYLFGGVYGTDGNAIFFNDTWELVPV